MRAYDTFYAARSHHFRKMRSINRLVLLCSLLTSLFVCQMSSLARAKEERPCQRRLWWQLVLLFLVWNDVAAFLTSSGDVSQVGVGGAVVNAAAPMMILMTKVMIAETMRRRLPTTVSYRDGDITACPSFVLRRILSNCRSI
jgi:hypothetical protein